MRISDSKTPDSDADIANMFYMLGLATEPERDKYKFQIAPQVASDSEKVEILLLGNSVPRQEAE